MKNLRVTFGASGYVTQDIEVPDEVTAEELEAKLNSGEWVTTIQEGGSLDVTATGQAVGKVLYVDNSLEYDEFSATEPYVSV